MADICRIRRIKMKNPCSYESQAQIKYKGVFRKRKQQRTMHDTCKNTLLPFGWEFFEKQRFRRKFNPRLMSLSCGTKTILNLPTKTVLNFPTKMALNLPTKMVLNFPKYQNGTQFAHKKINQFSYKNGTQYAQPSQRYSICPQKQYSICPQKWYSICPTVRLRLNLPNLTHLTQPYPSLSNFTLGGQIRYRFGERYSICPLVGKFDTVLKNGIQFAH